jgi:serine protease
MYALAHNVQNVGAIMRSVVVVTFIAAAALSAQSLPGPQVAAGGAVMSAARAQALSEAASRRLNYLPGEVVVKFREVAREPIESRNVRALAAVRSRLRGQGTIEWIGGTEAVVRDVTQADPRVMALQLAQQPEVEYAEPNYLYRLSPRTVDSRVMMTERDQLFEPRVTVPNDPGFGNHQWNFNVLDMSKAWDIEPGGKATIIAAVIDTGLTTQAGNATFKNWNGSAIVNQSFAFAVNPDIATSRIVSPYDFVNNSTVVRDMDGHGTHVAGTIGEDTNNNLLAAGMAYNVKIMPVKVCAGYWDVQFARSAAGIPGQTPLDAGGCANSAIAAGIRYAADNGANVINISLGGDTASQTVLSAITYAVGKGAFVATAGGNEYEDGNPAEWPASDAPGLDGLMSVAATNRSGNRAHYSNTGSYIEIAAPGGSSRDQSAGTGYVWQSSLIYTDQDPAVGFYTPRFDRYAEIGYQGTSMATPHVTGMAALMMSHGITSPSVVETIIRRTAKDIGDTGKDTSFGYGLIQPRAALFGVGVIK